MATAGSGAPAVPLPYGGSATADARLREDSDPAASAWVAALPCIVLVAVLAAVLGAPLGRLLAPDAGAYTFTPDFAKVVRPEPTEHARFLIALALPMLIALATATAPRWLARVPADVVANAPVAVQTLLAITIGACLLRQRSLVFGPLYTQDQGSVTAQYFTPATLAVSVLAAAAVVAALRHERLRQLGAAALRDTRPRLAIAALVALLATAAWVLPAVHSDASIATAPEDVRFHIAFPLDETFAVLNGLTPLVDYTAQYGSLWPFASALTMLVAGKTLLVFSIAMCTLTGLALLAMFDVLRRVARSAVGGLALYLPFLATSLFYVGGTFDNRTTVGTYFGTFPLRYAGPYLVAWLTCRLILRGGSSGRDVATWLLFTAGGLATLNNGDFGFAATGAGFAALVWSSQDRSRAWLLRLAATALAGLLTAFALVSLLTLARTGSLPQLERLVDYARLFTVAGFAMLPIPGLLGLHLVIYLTYVAAIATATVRAVRGEADRLLTGMLVWSGIFGLGSASYYVGRSHPVALKSTFSVWSLALALLTVVVVRELAAHPRRRPSIAAALVLVGFCVTACSLPQVSAPWSQAERLRAAFVQTPESHDPIPLRPPRSPSTRAFVATLADGPGRFTYRRGAPVAIMVATGHRVADAYGVRNVSPYTGMDSIPTTQRIEVVLDALRAAGGNTIILPNPLDPGIFPVLERRGFRLLTHHGLDRYDPSVPHSDAVLRWWPNAQVMKWVDTRHLHPRALRRPAGSGS